MFTYYIMALAFDNMAKLQRNKDIEAKIKIKSLFVQWYTFFGLLYALVPITWLKVSLLRITEQAPEHGTMLSMICYEYHTLVASGVLIYGMIFFGVSL